ncbi:helix-turn-helix transcriptional regulator [Myroides indicus]|uniref:Putative DNA-binding transcriptional regulator YafY n=1 Tax=Myroides indicus TaxID=1323422 RepID=A0A4R7EYJ3_9FLAO|nr:YafY family protein [Myroides indicus]TDS58873.1 putative DNA-binding transcriptional regulator YafY [Myroides indicus]
MDIKKRFDRILSLFIHLQSKHIVTAQELADRFNVSLRTVYRDIRSLEQAGVPIYSEAGVGYSLVDGYKIPPTLFTREEALSFAAAEKIMQVYVDQELSDHFTSALFKMKAVLRSSQKAEVSVMEPSILMCSDRTVFNKKVPSALLTLFKSISLKQQIEIKYRKSNTEKPISRIVEPIGVFYENNYWYFMAYCHLRQSYRQFRSDRVYSIELLENLFHAEHGTLDKYLPTKQIDLNLDVRILVDKKIAPYLVWDRKYYGFIKEIEHAEQTEMHFKMKNLENGFPRWFLMFADKAEIIEPEELKEKVGELLESVLTKHKN